jgi:RimJ/RimL family protein N-acetyltransferase
VYTTAPTLETERLVLRAHQLADFPPLAALFATGRSRFMNGPKSLDDVWRGFMCDVGQWPILGYGTWAIERKATGEYVGQVGLNRPPEYPEDELGWLLFDGFEGRGFAFEAAARARSFAFDVLRLPTLVSYVDPSNLRSIALAKRLGAARDPSAPKPQHDPCLVFRHPTPHRQSDRPARLREPSKEDELD